jgi:hypothetical protein
MPDIVTSRTFVDGEKNITAQKLNDIVASSVIQPAFVSAKPSTSTVAPTDNLLVLTAAGGTYAKAPFQTIIDSVNANLNTNSAIWSVRLRSFNAIGNPTFEVDQRNVGTTYPNVPNGTLIQDRWIIAKAGTLAVSAGQNSASAGINLPGTSFAISRSFLRITLTTAQATLAAGDHLWVQQSLEGNCWRELQNDVHSLQLLVRSSVAGLAIGVTLLDPTGAHALSNLLTIPSANTWTLLSLPNLALWPAAGTFVNTPGNAGYYLYVSLASGTTYIPPANGSWQNGNFVGAIGQSNFANSPVNSTFDLAYVCHEPGALCSNPPMDCPFTQNYHDCLRYYAKSYPFATKAAAINTEGYETFQAIPGIAASYWRGKTVFPVLMAKAPTAAIYAYDGSTNAVTYVTTSQATGPFNITTPVVTTEKGIDVLNSPTNYGATTWCCIFHYAADTGW